MEFEGTTAVIDRLRSQGYEVSTGYVQWLLRDRIIASPIKGPGGVLLWRPADAARLQAELIRRGRGPTESPAPNHRETQHRRSPGPLTDVRQSDHRGG